jgi:hypothetical protein
VHIELPRLSDAFFGESADLLWHLRSLSELIELNGSSAICSARFLGDSFAPFLGGFGSHLAIVAVGVAGANFASGLAMYTARLLGSFVS